MKQQVTSSPKKTFYNVAIGASAGGLEAVTQLLQNLPADTGMTFFYIQHLSPEHKSMLASLLSKSTRMKVEEARNKMRVRPDSFYVIPPNKEMTLSDGIIKLTPRKNDHAASLPIDTFFSSLAEKHKEESIGIVLSGSASDGTNGLKKIKQAGGLTFAQDESAKFTSMPQSAVAEGVVDFVLSPKEIAKELTRLSKHFVGNGHVIKHGKEDEVASDDPDLKIILDLLHKHTGVDFLYYKMNTIKRRILRRLLLYDLKTVREYAKLLKLNNNEIEILYQDLLINVTGFFRDTDAYRYLKSILFPKLLKSKARGETLRIWVPACSTGEEAYSMGMILLEMQDKIPGVAIQIFATDLSEQAINKARLGEYTAKELESVSPAYLKRFYIKAGPNYRVGKALREMCVFATHNILRDPPFSQLDFISCCNLLIYFDAEAQKKALTTFHFALKENGYLMLGNSETVGASQRLFIPINTKIKVWQRKKHTGKGVLPDLAPHFTTASKREENKITTQRKKTDTKANGLSGIIDSVIYKHYMPPCVVINKDMDILQFRGATDFYLTHTPGKASLNILKMIRPEIAFDLRNAIEKAFKTRHIVYKRDIEIKANGELLIAGLEAIPLTIEWPEPLLLILFNKHLPEETFSQAGKESKRGVIQKDRKIKKLLEEVAAYRSELHTVIENHEAAIEKLQSANEEIVSSNEELQTVNEELGTSKEEIQSTNEELGTVNQELLTRNELLTESHNYSEAIIATIHDSLLVLDKDLRIKSANKVFYDLFHLRAREVEGNKLFELKEGIWNIAKLRELIENVVVKNIHFSDFEVTMDFPGAGRKTLVLNASRIIQLTKSEPLILLAIADITESALLKNKKVELEKAVKLKTEEVLQANALLRQKNKDVEKVNKELESFAYIASHDLKEPLRIIRGFASLVVQKESEHLSDSGKEHLERIQTSIRRMQNLIDDLLTYSRTANIEKKFQETDILTVLEEVKVIFKKTITEKKAIIKVASGCKLNVIPFQFNQLLQNLLGNALKFAKPGVPPRISITCEISKGSDLNNKNLLPDTNYSHIIFEDNGIGFDQKYSERIFQVFQTLHAREKYNGTGIGLAIVKKIVDKYNGIITATGQLNKGARFDIYIPQT